MGSYNVMCFLWHNAKQEVLLNEIELELKAEGIISMYQLLPFIKKCGVDKYVRH